jgi:hypothetical protein
MPIMIESRFFILRPIKYLIVFIWFGTENPLRLVSPGQSGMTVSFGWNRV